MGIASSPEFQLLYAHMDGQLANCNMYRTAPKDLAIN